MNRSAQNRSLAKKPRSVAIRGFTDALLRRVKRAAKLSGRSMNKQIVLAVEQAHP